MALLTLGQSRPGRLIAGGILIAAAVGLALCGYFAPPRLSFADNQGFVAAPRYLVGPTGEYSGWVVLRYDLPVYPYPHRITGVSIPDSPLELEWTDVGSDPTLWIKHQSMSLRVFAPAPGLYEMTKIRIEFGRISRVYDIGRVVIDARDTGPNWPQMMQGTVPGSLVGESLNIQERDDHYYDYLGLASVTLVGMDAGPFGKIAGPQPDSDGNLNFSFTLPPEGTRPRSVWIRPWLTVSDGTKESLTIGMTYTAQSRH